MAKSIIGPSRWIININIININILIQISLFFAIVIFFDNESLIRTTARNLKSKA